jgi:protein-S-isoprenylcysteine O-methyltransferase Ste14
VLDKDSKVFGARFILLTFVGFLLVGAIIFLPAGRFDWTPGWTYLALTTLGWVAMMVLMVRRNPDLLRRRMYAGEGTKRWDRVILGLFRIFSLAIFVVAGLDAVRFGWSSMSRGFWFIGFLFHCLGYAVATWSMLENPHFEGTVRIQHDRAHRVIDSGPYSIVRHPGYVGFFLIFAAIPFLLGSWWAFVPAGLIIVTMLFRTWLEDRALVKELGGYEEYAVRVRYRLVPGIW